MGCADIGGGGTRPQIELIVAATDYGIQGGLPSRNVGVQGGGNQS